MGESAHCQGSGHARGLILDIADHYSIDAWLAGFVNLELLELEDIPGVDTDRRILRMFLFAEKAFRAVVAGKSEERQSKTEESQGDVEHPTKMKPQVDDQGSTLLESDPDVQYSEGDKVVVANIQHDDNDFEELSYCNGMQGRIVSVLADGEYLVSFSNLGRNQVLSKSRLAPLTKVPRDKHVCAVCDKKAKFLCERCSLTWYCGKACQQEHYEKHKEGCKALASQNPFLYFMNKCRLDQSED